MRMRTVTVTGHGSAPAVPDSAVVRVAAVRRAAGVAEAFAAVSASVERIGEVARRHTEPHRIASQGLNVWTWHDNQGEARGFEARHGLAIGCPDLTAAGSLLTDLAQEIGDALQLDGVTLEVSDPAAAQGRAREAAYADARERAAQLAALSDATLGAVQQVVEGGGARPMETGELARAASTSTARIEPGETRIGAGVTVTFELL
ncbi:SIMPL domain-containing protein [Nocardioides sp. LHG3406-4]|uniref:SIMPL domain-containing protein n=1 Tax=Nocardioides sp. LHG3406-4 TaxID=2804575 RepID=UPI003CEF19C4